jgi:hypothetical protein
MKYYVRGRKKTGPDLIYELSTHRTEEEAEQAVENARKSGNWESLGVTTATLRISGPKPRRSSGRRTSR